MATRRKPFRVERDHDTEMHDVVGPDGCIWRRERHRGDAVMYAAKLSHAYRIGAADERARVRRLAAGKGKGRKRNG